ncbi:putative pre-mRNA-splicing factor ATP-dependent RNA helicase [Forsythia ovata]|uniref:Pre-mRNA-splicing factor ATP-dependent RNA helicase n=1 Tax=Forsythia ovata TaxID=205694 RepID=A0ABD1UB14_9LAMI
MMVYSIVRVWRKTGFVVCSQIANWRIANAMDVVKRDQEVHMKVISVSGNKLSLSMMDVDKESGKDLLPLKTSGEYDELITNPSGRNNGGRTGSRIGISGIKITEEEEDVPSKRLLKNMSSPERW